MCSSNEGGPPQLMYTAHRTKRRYCKCLAIEPVRHSGKGLSNLFINHFNKHVVRTGIQVAGGASMRSESSALIGRCNKCSMCDSYRRWLGRKTPLHCRCGSSTSPNHTTPSTEPLIPGVYFAWSAVACHRASIGRPRMP